MLLLQEVEVVGLQCRVQEAEVVLVVSYKDHLRHPLLYCVLFIRSQLVVGDLAQVILDHKNLALIQEHLLVHHQVLGQ
jgi:hypothetical protein